MMRRLGLLTLLLVVAAFGRVSRPVAADPPAPTPHVLTDDEASRPASPLNSGEIHAMPALQSNGGAGAQAAAQPNLDPTLPMTFHNGTLMASSTNYVIFWQPQGVHFEPSGTDADDTRYKNLITRLFRDIGGSTLYRLASQYSMPNITPPAPLNQSSTFGGSYVLTTAYPKAGTAQDPVTDADLQQAVTDSIAANALNGWAANPTSIFFIYTGINIVSCARGVGCSFAFTNPNFTGGGYCAYHSAFNIRVNPLTGVALPGYTLYANQPDAWSTASQGFSPACGAFSPNGPAAYSPNGDAGADGEISTTVHELFETVTDPLGYSFPVAGVQTVFGGWYETDGSGEIGDKCFPQYGTPDASGRDITINGNPYVIQPIWSNRAFNVTQASGSGCVFDQLPRLGDLTNDGVTNFNDAVCMVYLTNPPLPVPAGCPTTLPPAAISAIMGNGAGQATFNDAICLVFLTNPPLQPPAGCPRTLPVTNAAPAATSASLTAGLSGASLKLTPDAVHPGHGRVAVQIVSQAGVRAWQLDLHYNPKEVTVTCTPAAGLLIALCPVDQRQGDVKLIGAAAQALSGQATMAELTLTPRTPSVTSSRLSLSAGLLLDGAGRRLLAAPVSQTVSLQNLAGASAQK